MEKFHTVYIGLGSNLDSPEKHIRDALAALSQLPNSKELQCSHWYSSIAVGPGQQPNYINAAACLETTLTPEALLEQLQAIENAHGRQRQVRWGARTLDLDLLLYGDKTINSETLTVPHPEMLTRNFVVHPLYDLNPHLLLSNGQTSAECKEQLTADGLFRIDDSITRNHYAQHDS